METKYEILVVDDDPDFRESLRIILEKNGYSVVTATNGSEALEAIEDSVPDLMILDIMMATDTEGLDLALEIKNRPEFDDLPIILLSSFLDKVRADGPDEFQHILGESWPAKWLFEKPMNHKKLLSKIEKILKES